MYFDTSILDCLQPAFSLKIRLVLISASTIAIHDIMLHKGIGIRQEKMDSYFFFFLRPHLLRFACVGFACSNFEKKNKRLLAVYVDTAFTARYIVSAASSEFGIAGALLCVEAWAKHGVIVGSERWQRKQVENKERHLIKVAKGRYARTRVCLRMKTTDLKRLMLRFI